MSVLGRKEGYSPAEDSGVRSRAYELRNKLKSYYRDEAPEDPIQIEIEKGAYVPRFQRREAMADAERPGDAPHTPVPTEPATSVVGSADSRGRRVSRSGVAALVGLALVALLATLWLARARPTGDGLAPQASTREMKALWNPFLDSRTPLLISFEIRLFLYAPATGLVVRDAQTNQMAEVAQSKALAAFQERMGTDKLIRDP